MKLSPRLYVVLLTGALAHAGIAAAGGTGRREATRYEEIEKRVALTGEFCSENEAPYKRSPEVVGLVNRGQFEIVAIRSDCVFTYEALAHILVVRGGVIKAAPFASRPDWAIPNPDRGWIGHPPDAQWAESSLSGAWLYTVKDRVFLESVVRDRALGDGGIAELYEWKGSRFELVLQRQGEAAGLHPIGTDQPWPISAPPHRRCEPGLLLDQAKSVLLLREFSRRTSAPLVEVPIAREESVACRQLGPKVVGCTGGIAYMVRAQGDRWEVVRSESVGTTVVGGMRRHCSLQPRGIPTAPQ